MDALGPAYGCPMAPDVQLQCAAVAAWASAALRGAVSLDAAIDALRSLSIEVRFQSPDDVRPQPLALAVGDWRSRGIDGWRFVPVAAGDSGGLPGPPGLFASAMDVGAAIVSLSGPSVALVPACSEPAEMLLEEMPCSGRGTAPPESLTELDQQLLATVTEVTELFDRLEVAEWRDEVLDLLRTWDDLPPIPPGTPVRAQRLAARGGRLMRLVDLATADDGGSRTASEMSQRSEQLRRLARVARAAQAAGWNAAAMSAGAPG